ncbi:hypothetical protein HXZ93_13320 [Acinetobacter pseudolwoffii]|uniref:AAA family ATPase n=1 Tax=Acinetobacter pseudolwoffii TaxID=2053287 RepID=UPI0025774BC8|nr:AAA family ATPase [Acinetobacter pseudolwoffii]MDM1336975.1 hypothetical protein [Acinetobacter pseudolwoffii]
MKILRLSLNNLASLTGTHHIDFESSPLTHAGLIAITGKTGAGKSTLLDAMCLALYNEIPRLKGATGSLKDAGGQDVSIKDSKNILRRGCVHGFAELEFIALDSKRYTARWEIRRARQKVDGNLKVDRYIKCIDDDTTLTQKISEVTPLIEKLLGLSFEQFTRAVLLAQSEVGAFLKAKDHERADLLEYLTNSQIFSEVSKKAAEKHSQVRQKRHELENWLGHLELLSEDDITQLQQQHTAFNQILEHFNQSEKLLENDLKWHRQKHALYTEIQAKKEIYDVQLDADQKLTAQKQLLVHLDEFQGIREQFIQQNQMLTQQQQLTIQQQSFEQQLQQVQQQRDAEFTQLAQIQQQQQAHVQHMHAMQPHLEQGLKLDHEMHLVGNDYKKKSADLLDYAQQYIQPLQQQIESSKQQLASAAEQQQQRLTQLEQQADLAVFDLEPQSTLQRLQDYQKLYQQMQQQAPAVLSQSRTELEHSRQQLAQQIESLQQQFGNQAQLEQQLQQHQTVQQQSSTRLLKLEGLIQHVARLAEQEAEQQQLKQDVAHAQTELTQLEHTEIQLQQTVSNTEQEFEQLQNMLQQQRLLQTQSVQELRAQLKPDEACMVCGSQQHPFVQHQALLDTALNQLQDQQLQQAQQQLNQLKDDLKATQIQQSKIKMLLEQKQQRLIHIERILNEQHQTLQQNLKELGLEPANPDHSAQLLHPLQTQLGQWQQQHTQANEQFKILQQTWQAWRQQQQQLDSLQLSLQKMLQLDQLIEPVLTVLPEAQQLAWHKNAPAACTQLQQHLQQRLHLVNQVKTAEQELQGFKQQLNQAQQQLQMHEQRHTQIQAETHYLLEQGKDLRQQLNQLTEQHAGQTYKLAAEWRLQLDTQLKALDSQLQAQRQVYEQHEQALHQALLKQQALLTQMQQLTQQQAQSDQAIRTWQNLHRHFNAELLQQCLTISLSEHQQIRQQLQAQHQALENAKIAWQTLEDQYQKHLQQQPELAFEEVEAHLNSLAQEKTEQQNSFNEIDTKLRMNANNQNTYAKYQQQIEQVKAEEYRWGRIYDLIGHKEGTKFQKIAQEHHLDILVEYANQQLQPLAPRYQLHRIPDSLSLAIIDLDMNSEVRPVLSLSGGETFLVSLALALAIANMASGSMKLESLFIDEGFGTLDPASLHMVMNALDHLQSQGRKVVLISHVQEMHERIPVQIQVKPVGAGASTIQIIG